MYVHKYTHIDMKIYTLVYRNYKNLNTSDWKLAAMYI